jgi:excisionase family DNA binding protein
MQNEHAVQQLLTVAQVAEMLGMKQATIRNWIWRRSIPYVKLKNRSIRIKLAVLQALIAEGEIPALRK